MGSRPGWHVEEIKAALRRRYGHMTHLSTSWGYGRAAISNVLRRPLYSIPLERRIAEALDQHPHTLWSDRWRPDGTSLPRSGAHATSSDPVPTSERRKAG